MVQIIAGVDEVGRGALFGPVVAAAVILPGAAQAELLRLGVKDSKQLTAKSRHHLAQQIQALAIDCQIGVASVREIDRLNILQAALLAMKRAIGKLHPQPQLCLVDGNQPIPQLGIAQQTVVQGDQTVLEISAASIVAKVWRDQIITTMARKYSGYDLANNKGYGTARHRQALAEIGLSPFHRRSFKLR